MDFSFFFQRTQFLELDENGFYGEQSLFSKTDIYLGDPFPDWQQGDVILLSVELKRKETEPYYFDLVRKHFYQLSSPHPGVRICDLGHFAPDPKKNDVLSAFLYVMEHLLKANKSVVILCDDQVLSYAQFLAYETLEEQITCVHIDSHLDLQPYSDEITPSNVNYHILSHGSDFLWHFASLGVQSYYLHDEEIAYYHSHHYEWIRLSHLKQNIRIAEPYFRLSHMTIMDLRCMDIAYAPAVENQTPAGFSLSEMSILARFAGMSYYPQTLGIYNVNREKDEITAQTCAIILWHFIEGTYHKVYDYPAATRSNLMRHRILLTQSIVKEIVFYHNPQTERWWMEIPYPQNEGRSELIPVSYYDYLTAKKNQVPDRWWIFSRKLGMLSKY